MKFGSLNFLPLALYFFISSCAPLYYLPYYDEIKKIEKMPVKNREFDCVDKSTLYHKFLKERGIESKIVSGNVKGLSPGIIHAWVEVYNSEYNEWYIVDPTLFGREDKNDGIRVSYPIHDRIKWLEYSEDATPEDIRNHRKIKIIYPKNVPREFIKNF